MSLQAHIDAIDAQVEDSSKGLPKEVFYLASRLTPMVNVDLLVKNDEGQTLLTWREDEYYGPGWHVPGGIVRFKEAIATRINAVAASELGAKVACQKDPLRRTDGLHPTRNTRGHFISLLYECVLISPVDPRLEYKTGGPKNGECAWHTGCPDNLIAAHGMYKIFIGNQKILHREYPETLGGGAERELPQYKKDAVSSGTSTAT